MKLTIGQLRNLIHESLASNTYMLVQEYGVGSGGNTLVPGYSGLAVYHVTDLQAAQDAMTNGQDVEPYIKSVMSIEVPWDFPIEKKKVLAEMNKLIQFCQTHQVTLVTSWEAVSPPIPEGPAVEVNPTDVISTLDSMLQIYELMGSRLSNADMDDIRDIWSALAVL